MKNLEKVQNALLNACTKVKTINKLQIDEFAYSLYSIYYGKSLDLLNDECIEEFEMELGIDFCVIKREPQKDVYVIQSNDIAFMSVLKVLLKDTICNPNFYPLSFGISRILPNEVTYSFAPMIESTEYYCWEDAKTISEKISLALGGKYKVSFREGSNWYIPTGNLKCFVDLKML